MKKTLSQYLVQFIERGLSIVVAVIPKTIDNDSRGDRIFPVNQPLRKVQPVRTSIGVVHFMENLWNRRLDDVALSSKIPSYVYFRSSPFGGSQLFHNRCGNICLGDVYQLFLQLNEAFFLR